MPKSKDFLLDLRFNVFMKIYHCLGLMSGTSLDGLDIAYIRFTYPEITFELIKTATVPYSEEWNSKLKKSIHLSGEELIKLDVDYGFLIAKKVADFIKEHQISNLDFIASHGHTVFHNPKEKYTLQIGNGQAIALETGIKTVYDFRTKDVLLGGQGAPLVPIGDRFLFSIYDACLNLGGFSNISFEKKGERIAFDICPVNIVLNYLAGKEGKLYDENGELAQSGQVNEVLFLKLNELDFYGQIPPKSLGVEWSNRFILPLLDSFDLSVCDWLATFSQHISYQICRVLNENSIKNVLITGGGAYNSYLLQLIKSQTKAQVHLPEKKIIEYKEALIFGLLGLLRLENQVNVLSSVTGAKKNHCSGCVVNENS